MNRHKMHVDRHLPPVNREKHRGGLLLRLDLRLYFLPHRRPQSKTMRDRLWWSIYIYVKPGLKSGNASDSVFFHRRVK